MSPVFVPAGDLDVPAGFSKTGDTLPSNVLDLAINGGGFFMQSNGGAISYTRNGQFKLNDQGGIVNSNTGFALVGMRTDGSQGELSISAKNLAPTRSTLLKAGLNLSSVFDSATPAITAAFVASADGETPASTTYSNKTSTTFYDSLGNSHVLDMYYVRADSTAANPSPNYGAENTWYFAAKVDGKDVSIPGSPTANNADNLRCEPWRAEGAGE